MYLRISFTDQTKQDGFYTFITLEFPL